MARSKITKEKEIILLNMYHNKKDDTYIARQLNVSKNTIFRYRQKHNLPSKYTKLKDNKLCMYCNIVKSIDEFDWKQKSRNSKDSFCKNCAKIRQEAKRLKNYIKHTNTYYDNLTFKTKTCSKCNKTLNVKKFYKNKNSSDGYRGECKTCTNEYKSLKKEILKRIKQRAIARKIEFNLQEKDLFLPTHCPLLNIQLEYLTTAINLYNSASLDRIDNNKGYIKGNVMIISRLANTMKNKANFKELENFSNNMLKLINYFKTQDALGEITDIFPNSKEYTET